jgi:hypothetical protein
MANEEKIYMVEVPVLMRLSVAVRATSEKEAIETVLHGDDLVKIDVTSQSDIVEYHDWEWDMFEKMTSGNIYHGHIHEVGIGYIEDIDDDEY